MTPRSMPGLLTAALLAALSSSTGALAAGNTPATPPAAAPEAPATKPSPTPLVPPPATAGDKGTAGDGALGTDAPAPGAAGADASPAPAVPSNSAAKTPTVTDPQRFADMAGTANMFEIAASKLALTHSQSPDIKDFAQKMIDDHGKAAKDLSQAADKQGVTLPDAMTDIDKARIQDLQSATNFDRLYVNDQIVAHETAVALFQGYADGGPDGALRDFARATLPTLKEHLHRIRTLAGQ